MRVVFLILDAFPNDHVDPVATPTLWEAARTGGRCVDGGVSVMPSNTYPNHASFATGAEPAAHGIIANYVWDGSDFVHSSSVGPALPTMFDAVRAAGHRTAIVAGDQEIVKTMGGERTDTHWPPDGDLPEGTPVDDFGYAADAAVLAALDEHPVLDADLLVVHLNEPDTTLHVHGLEAAASLAQFTDSDASAAAVLHRLQDGWDDTVVIIVSDHTQETVDPDDPIGLVREFVDRGFKGTVRPEGTTAQVVNGPSVADLLTLESVESAEAVTEQISLVYSEAGRMFAPSFGMRGMHGSARTSPQVAIVTGGHARVAELASALATTQPRATDWAPTILTLLGLDPTESLPTASGTSLL